MSSRDKAKRSARLRKQITGSLTTLGMLALAILRAVQVTSGAALGKSSAFLMLGVGVLASGRILVHLRDRYWQWDGGGRPWTSAQRRRLNGLVVADVAIALTLLAAGVRFVSHPDNWVELGLLVSITAAMAYVSAATVTLTREGGLPRGSETIGNCWAVKGVRNVRKAFFSVRFVKKLDRFVWKRRTRLKRASGFVVAMVALLSAGAIAQAAAVAPDVVRYMSQSPLKPKEKADVSDNRISASSDPSLAGLVPALGTRSPASIAPDLPPQPTPILPSPDQPTYEDLCGSLAPGDGAPTGQATAMQEAWLRLGAVVAGCAQPARLVPTSDATYYAVGTCNGEPISLGVVTPDRRAAVLLDDPASFARDQALAGKLRGASPRTTIATGDFQVVDSTDGGYLAIRREVSDGRGGPLRAPTRCGDLRRPANRYVILPPALADLWLRLGALGRPTWPRALGAGSFAFDAPGDEHETVATGSCSGPSTCGMEVDGVSWKPTTDGAPITVERVLADGPSS